MLEHYVLEAASENVSMLLLTSIVSSCPTSVVLVAEDVGGCLFFERRKEEGDGTSEALTPTLVEQHIVPKIVLHDY